MFYINVTFVFLFLTDSFTLFYNLKNKCCFYRDKAGVQDTFMTYEVYKDDITMRLVAEACKLLGKNNFFSVVNYIGLLVGVLPDYL